MAESGSDRAASDRTAVQNLWKIGREVGRNPRDLVEPSESLRRELRDKGIQGFKRGGRVHRTGIYKLHRGERVIPARGRRGRRR